MVSQRVPARIAGREVVTEHWIEVRNPYDQSVVGEVPACGAAEVNEAVGAAQEALAAGAFPQFRRAQVLDRAAGLLRERQEEFARTIALEAGKPIKTARGEATRAVETFLFAAAACRDLGGEVLPMEATEAGVGKLGFTLRVPIGVVAAISPFNFPLNLVAHKVAPAIAAGCPVVLKPASVTPMSALALADLLEDAGLPAGYLHVVTGSGKAVGDPLVDDPRPRLVSFTGSPEVGWGIAARAPRKRVKLELGSNSPLIVEPDADLDAVAAKVRVAGFSHAGQSCISTQRILVHRDIEDGLAAALRTAVQSLVLGDPLDEATDVGPLIAPEEAERVRRLIDDAVAGGAEIVCGGDMEGSILRPTVLRNTRNDQDVCQREVFGPVVAMIAYGTFDEAIALANDSDFGLHAGVFTKDLGKALAAARRLEFGGVLVNEVPTFRADLQPYGGVKDSGNTREGPRFAVEEMTEMRFVSFQA